MFEWLKKLSWKKILIITIILVVIVALIVFLLVIKRPEKFQERYTKSDEFIDNEAFEYTSKWINSIRNNTS